MGTKVGKIDAYRVAVRAHLHDAGDLEAYLRAESRLPGPRSNLELLAAAAEELDADWCLRWANADVGAAQSDVFLISIGLVGLGRMLAVGDDRGLTILRRRAGDGEWRVREAVAIGLQRLGDADPRRMAGIAADWAGGSALEQRAAMAAVCEPRLLRDPSAALGALQILDRATRSLMARSDRRDPDLRVLRQALGYGWSVAVVALPAEGWPRFEAWCAVDDPDIRWIVAENLRKNRLVKLDPARVDRLRRGLGSSRGGPP